MTTYTIQIDTRDSNGKGRSVLIAQVTDTDRSLAVTEAVIDTDEHGTPTAGAVTALRCLALLETIASHATGISVASPDAEISQLKAEVTRLKSKLEQLVSSPLS